MIQAKPDFTIVTDALTTKGFSISDKNMAGVMEILSTNIYADRILAPIREYYTNAREANQMSGSLRPVQITVPGILEPTFKVRDFGPGLSEDDMYTVFISYGESTKANSNDYEGMFGLGCKSAFAYTHHFNVTSYYDGVKKVYDAYINEDHRGVLSKILEEPSDEPSGLCVSFSVLRDDIYTFQAKITEFFLWNDDLPEFIGYDTLRDINSKKQNIEVIFESDTVKLYKNTYYSYNRSQAIHMGSIIYPLDVSKFSLPWAQYCSSIIKVSVGDVSVTTSREALRYDQKTLASIAAKILEVQNEFTDGIQANIDSNETPWEAIQYYKKLGDITRKILGDTFMWRGQLIDPKFMNSYTWAAYRVHSNQWKKDTINDSMFERKIGVIVNDGGFPQSYASMRIKDARAKLLADNCTDIFLCKDTITRSKEFLEEYAVNGLCLVSLSEVATNPSKRGKAQFKGDELLLWNGTQGYPYSGCWTPVQEPADTGENVYVSIASYKPVNWSFDNLRKIVNELRTHFGINLNVYGVKKPVKGMEDFKELNEFLAETINEAFGSEEYVSSVRSILIENLLSQDILDIMSSTWAKNVNCPHIKQLKAVDLRNYAKNKEYSRALNRLVGLTVYGTSYNIRTKLDAIEDVIKKGDLEYGLIKANIDYVEKNYPFAMRSARWYSQTEKDFIKYVNAMHAYNLAQVQTQATV